LRFELFQRLVRLCSIHGRWAASHHDGYTDGFDDFFAGRPSPQRVMHVIGDTPVTASGDADAERDEFFYFCIQCAVSYCMPM
jgi:hypothetical protein